MATYRKRGNRWQVRVRRGGAAVSGTFPTKREAEDWARRRELDEERPTGRVASASIGEVIERVLALPIADGWSRSTRDNILRGRDFLGHLTDPTRLDVAHALRRVTLSPSTVDVTLRSLSGALFRLDEGEIAAQAIKDTLKARKRTGEGYVTRERDRRFSGDEIAALKEAWRSEVPVDVLDFLTDLPIRSGEMCNLRRADLTGKTILVRDRKHPTRKHTDRVPLLGRSYEILMAQPQRGPLVFPFLQWQVSNAFRAAAARACVADARLHDLRHEGISRLFDAGWKIQQVAAVSGHHSWVALKRYTHQSPERLLELPLPQY